MSKASRQILNTIKAHGLISPGDQIVLGVSGGPDSMCLFDGLIELSEEWRLVLHPVHVNHMLRGEDAVKDQHFVESFCSAKGLSCESVRVDCGKMAEDLGMTLEEAGRKARYDAFFEAAGRVAVKCRSESESVKIAVAHNADDQAETVLFRVLRGAGTDGLAGMAYSRKERRGGKSFSVIRPLLDTWRRDIEEHCEERKLRPVTDETNSEAIYARNRLRLELIPHLEGNYNENIRETLVRMSRIMASDRDYISKAASKAYSRVLVTEKMQGHVRTAASDGSEAEILPVYGMRNSVVLDRERLAACHDAIRHRIVMRAFAEIGLTSDITEERLKAADKIIMKKQGPKKVEFPHGYALAVAKGRVVVRRDQ